MPENKEKAKRPRGTGSVFQFKGKGSYWIKYYKPGDPNPVRENTHSTKIKAAENLLKQRIGELAVNTWIAPTDRKTTVDDLYAGLLADYQNNGMASLEGAQQRWEWNENPGRLKKFFSGIRAIAVSTDMLNRYVSECREQELSNGTINRDMAALRRAFNLAKRAGKIQSVPFFPHLKESAPRDGFVEEGDYQAMAKNAPELWLRTILAVCYTFGLRKGEVIGDRRKGYRDALKVRHVDLISRTIRLKETKNGEDRIIPMTQEVYTLLAACVSGKGLDDFVFTDDTGKHRKRGSQIKDFRGRWEKLLADSGVSDDRMVHDNRRSAVKNMERAGIPRSVAMKISGHRTESVYRRYAIVSERDLQDAARKIEAGKGVWAEFGQSLKPETQQQMTQAAGKQVN